MTQALETAATVSTGDILISVFDDFGAPDEWDVRVKDRLRDQDGKCLFVYDDMHDVSVTLQTMTIMTRRYIWESAPFGKIQGLPTGCSPVTLWDDRDSAWADVVKGVRALA
jgi:hypothetical protein